MMGTEQSTISRLRELYERSSSTAPKERLYRRLTPSEVQELSAILEGEGNPEAETRGDVRDSKE